MPHASKFIDEEALAYIDRQLDAGRLLRQITASELQQVVGGPYSRCQAMLKTVQIRHEAEMIYAVAEKRIENAQAALAACNQSLTELENERSERNARDERLTQARRARDAAVVELQRTIVLLRKLEERLNRSGRADAAAGEEAKA